MLNFRHLERTFWTVFIILPIFTGLLAYDWLPNEAFNEKRHELLSSHEVCRDVGEAEECGDMADVGRDRVTGQVYTRQQFSEHRRAERWRVLYVDFGHGLIGCLFFGYARWHEHKAYSSKPLERRSARTSPGCGHVFDVKTRKVWPLCAISDLGSICLVEFR